jgi:hypothetical protein
MAFSNSFTGKGTGVLIPSGEGLQRAQENMSNMMISAEKLKLETFQKNQAEFLKNASIDPVFVLSESARELQGKMLDKFNTDWGKTMKDRGGTLSTDDKMQMAKEKNYILMEQQKMAGDMQRAMQDRDVVSKDIQGNLDREDFDKRWNNFIKTGTYDTSPLLPKEIDPDEYFNRTANKVNGTPSNVTVTKTIGGIPVKETYQSSGSEQEGRERVKATLLGNDRIARGYIKKFHELKTSDPATYKKYLDTNNNGVISPTEEGATNPILQWAQDNYWHKALDVKLSQPTKIASGKTATAGISVGGTAFKTPGIQREGQLQYGDEKYIRPYSFGGQKLNNIPTQGGTLISSDGTSEKLENGTMEGNLLHYDAGKDVLLFSNASATNNPAMKSNDIVEVPASNLVDVDNLPIKIGDRMGTVGELRKGKTQKTTTTAPKKRFNVVTGKFE